MKKKICILIIVCLFLIIGIISFIIWNDNKVVSTITLDINPSIKINLDRNEKVKSIIALNNDATEIIDKDTIVKSLKDVFEMLITNLIEKGYARIENDINVILYVNGTISNEEVSKQLEFEFGKKNVHAEIIAIDNITKEDEKLASKYNVTPAKIAYIKTIIKNSENIDINNLTDESVSELVKIKNTGRHCDEGYILDGDWCKKEINRVSAINGNVCPSGYTEYNGICYEELKSVETNNYICSADFKLVDDKCILETSYDAKGKCDLGTYEDGYCVKNEYYGDAKEYCRITPEEDLLYNGRCLGRKPTINGGCLNGDNLIDGYCYDTSPSSGYKADWVCPDGSFITNPDSSLMYEDKKCYKEIKTKPTSYYCEDNDKLNGEKCEVKIIEEAVKERICPNDTNKIDDGSRCLNFNNSVNKEIGYYCEQENSELEGKICIIYDIIESKVN